VTEATPGRHPPRTTRRSTAGQTRPPGVTLAGRPFPREILAGDTLDAARATLGALLVRDPERAGEARRSGRIVEVEAYVGLDDRASHARMGPTPRNRVMFGPPGIAYVYMVYGHVCINVVSGPDGFPAAILLRSAVPVEGAEAMRAARVARAISYRRADRDNPDAAAARLARVPDALLAVGPANLAAAFGVERSDNGADLLDPASPVRLELAPDGEVPVAFVATPRIGVAHSGPGWAGRPWRFVDARVMRR
jgi:DNA-3-methyladenine glycosylase